jgi:hypothetical protein
MGEQMLIFRDLLEANGEKIRNWTDVLAIMLTDYKTHHILENPMRPGDFK